MQLEVSTVDIIKLLRSEESFDMFWLKINKIAEDLDIEEPQLPRRRERTGRYDDGLSSGNFHDSPKSLYRQIKYYEAIDLVVNCITDRFNQPGYRIYVHWKMF